MLVWSLARRRDQIYRAVVGISVAAVPLKLEMHPLKDERSDRDAEAHDDEILHRIVPVGIGVAEDGSKAAFDAVGDLRSAERGVGRACVSESRSRGSREHKKR